MSSKVLVFGGTTEGRVLAGYLRDAKIPHEISVATEYGGEILRDTGEDSLVVGRKNAEEITQLIKSDDFSVVVDSTHPFATAVSKEIKTACEMTGVTYLRLKRNTDAAFDGGRTIFVDTLEEAISELSKEEGRILLLTGSKDLEKIAVGLPDVSRVFARVLPNEESIAKCVAAGLKGRQIIAMQGPFSKQMNVALIKEVGASVILTKESGKTGGLDEKLEAAGECGVKTVVIKNPEKLADSGEGCDIREVMEHLAKDFGLSISDLDGIFGAGTASCAHVGASHGESAEKSIVLGGIGPGDDRFHTKELQEALDNADIIFGAESVISRLEGTDIPKIPMYRGDEICEYLSKNPGFTRPVAVFSGDISLCSGAKKAAVILRANGYNVTTIPGISSVTLFLKALRIGLEDVRIVTAHGRSCNVGGYVRECENLIILPSGISDAQEICREISKNTDKIVIGYELGTADEKVFELGNNEGEFEGLMGKCLIYAHNAGAAERPVKGGISDDEFIRGKTPMTKEEIRAISIRKLSLTSDAIFYDIGAGTGSVSIEAALTAPGISVFSIEKKEDAVALLSQNKDKFGVSNMEIIEGTAPEALAELPAPTHAFIGGSSGNMKSILGTVLDKNAKARIVINCVTAETFSEVMECLKELPVEEPDILQLWASRHKKVGNYHMADAINPVYIITLEGKSFNG
ncbi:precorrin-6A reductase [Butyrivibrio sp. WCD3002]|uniref:precorrin-6A reductase n=1 Tax=Butyrivibrio sp. WCD3002 TaxID=1280676 RepID=UPI0003FFC181|nr:precorrin-6A reductase [Butyrivibrio sp. WCD3002]